MSSPVPVIFSKDDTLIDIIREDFNILPILSRFSITLGFGSRSIEDICRDNNIATDLFLLIINFIFSKKIDLDSVSLTSASGLVDFLQNSHDYFLSYKFPHIRNNLILALDKNHQEINPAIIRFFDEYVNEVANHFKYEETTVFPYIRSLTQDRHTTDYNINTFSKNHKEISDNLVELKNIILRAYKTAIPYRMYDVLVDLYNCDEDLRTHTDIENHILVPLIRRIEEVNMNL